MNRQSKLFFVLTLACAHTLTSQVADRLANTSKPGYETYDRLHIPVLVNIPTTRPIIVAVIDDGFRLSHKALKSAIYTNKNEIPNNGKDDDNNGYVDDVSGWDISDHDNDVSVPVGREADYYHGTMVAGIITTVAERCFGVNSSRYIQILPVKVLSNRAQSTYLKEGYEGIAYAVKMGADIICCAWSGGEFDEKYRPVFDEAARKGIMIIASAGNLFSENIPPPASITSVFAVAAVDTALHKLETSNYGRKIDLVAFGELVRAPYPQKDNAYIDGDGTSSAVALVAGCAAVLKAVNRSLQPSELFSALRNTATPLDQINARYGGKLGAGLPDLAKAVNYILLAGNRDAYFNSGRAKGEIVIDRSTQLKSWEIAPAGGYVSIDFTLIGNSQKYTKNRINIFSKDSLLFSYPVIAFPQKVIVPGGYAKIELTGKPGKDPLSISYTADPIDSTRLYCSETRYFEKPEDELSDGSEGHAYANNSACKWQITVDKTKRVKLIFDELDTQANVDFVYIFSGTSTLQENLLAKFSGHTLPPIIISPGNEVLIWFVTDKTITGKGWHCSYSAVEEAPGYILPEKHPQ
jgi:serine protease